MPLISISITENQNRHIKRLGNRSKYVRDLIDAEIREQLDIRCNAVMAIYPAFQEALIVASKNGCDFSGIMPAFQAKLKITFGEIFDNHLIETYFIQKISVFDKD